MPRFSICREPRALLFCSLFIKNWNIRITKANKLLKYTFLFDYDDVRASKVFKLKSDPHLPKAL